MIKQTCLKYTYVLICIFQFIDITKGICAENNTTLFCYKKDDLLADQKTNSYDRTITSLELTFQFSQTSNGQWDSSCDFSVYEGNEKTIEYTGVKKYSQKLERCLVEDWDSNQKIGIFSGRTNKGNGRLDTISVMPIDVIKFQSKPGRGFDYVANVKVDGEKLKKWYCLIYKRN